MTLTSGPPQPVSLPVEGAAGYQVARSRHRRSQNRLSSFWGG